MITEVNPFFCPLDKKMTSPRIEWCIGKCPGLCTLFFKTSTWYLMVYALSRSYLDVWDTLKTIPFLCQNCALGAFITLLSKTVFDRRPQGSICAVRHVLISLLSGDNRTEGNLNHAKIIQLER